MKEKWLLWASELQSIAQAGLTFGADRYDLDRYEKIRNIVVEILHEYTNIDHKKIRELFASETGYQTPKVDIRASVFKDNKILMIREKADGAWALPEILKHWMRNFLSRLNCPNFLLPGILLPRSKCVSKQKNAKYSRLSLIKKIFVFLCVPLW